MLAERVYQPYYDEQPLYEAKKIDKKEEVLGVKAKIKIMAAIVVAGIVAIAIVVGTAFTSTLLYQNNMIEKENAKIAKQIQILKVEVKSQSNVGTVENTALKKLGMVYPVGEQFVQIKKSSSKNFAAQLKKEAFN